MLGSYHTLHQKPITVPEFKDARQLTALPDREPLATPWKASASDWRHVCIS